MYNYHHTDLKKNGKKFDIFHLEHIIYPFKLLLGDILNHSHFFVKSISRKNIFCACLKHCVLLFLLKNMIRKRDARILKECKLWYQSLLFFLFWLPMSFPNKLLHCPRAQMTQSFQIFVHYSTVVWEY